MKAKMTLFLSAIVFLVFNSCGNKSVNPHVLGSKNKSNSLPIKPQIAEAEKPVIVEEVKEVIKETTEDDFIVVIDEEKSAIDADLISCVIGEKKMTRSNLVNNFEVRAFELLRVETQPRLIFNDPKTGRAIDYFITSVDIFPLTYKSKKINGLGAKFSVDGDKSNGIGMQYYYAESDKLKKIEIRNTSILKSSVKVKSTKVVAEDGSFKKISMVQKERSLMGLSYQEISATGEVIHNVCVRDAQRYIYRDGSGKSCPLFFGETQSGCL